MFTSCQLFADVKIFPMFAFRHIFGLFEFPFLNFWMMIGGRKKWVLKKSERKFVGCISGGSGTLEGSGTSL